MKRTPLFLLCLVFILTGFSSVRAEENVGHGPVKPAEREKCPVCGMFVAKYPDWTAQIIFKDGQRIFFDGAKDMFKYYFNLKKYNPRKTQDDIAGIYLTEYYDLDFIEAHKTCLVIGGTVYGPMGRELIPFASKADAQQFMKDHSGKRVITFDEVTPQIIEKLDD